MPCNWCMAVIANRLNNIVLRKSVWEITRLGLMVLIHVSWSKMYIILINGDFKIWNTHLLETIATSYMYTLLWTKEIDVVLNHINYWNTEGGGAGVNSWPTLRSDVKTTKQATHIRVMTPQEYFRVAICVSWTFTCNIIPLN